MKLPRLLRNPWLAQGLLAIVLLGLAVWQTDTAQIAESLKEVRPEWLIVALVVYLCLRLLQARETQIALTKVGRVPLFGLYGVLFIGSLVNAILPANMGDVAKVQILANRYGLPRVGLVASRGAEAVVNAILFVTFVIVSVVLVSGQTEGGTGLQLALAGVSSAFCGALIAAALFTPETLPDWPWLRRLPRRVFALLEEHWPRLHAGFEAVRRPRLLFTLLALNLVGWGIEIGMYWAYGNAFNLDVPFGAYVSVTVVVALVTTFPITFGNVGSWEVAMLAALRVYDVPTDAALAFAVGAHVFVALFNIGLGLTAMALLGVRPRDLLQMRRAAVPEKEPALDPA